MEPFGGPAALGGLATGLMLAGWMLGRWHGGLPDAAPWPDAAPSGAARALPRQREPAQAAALQAGPGHQAARDERRAAFDDGAFLGELHADVSAYRRAQRVLSDGELTATFLLGRNGAGADDSFRYIGISGQPTCPAPQVLPAPCACRSCSPA